MRSLVGINALAVSEEVMLELSNFAEKLRRQGIMIADTATALLCHDMTLQSKNRVVMELSLPKPGGMCYHQILAKSGGGP